MNKQDIHVLVIDDIQFIGEKIQERLAVCNKKYYDDFLNIVPWYYKFRLYQKSGEEKILIKSVKEIEAKIKENNIRYLLLDRRFIRIVDKSYEKDFPDLELKKNVYSDNRKEEIRYINEVLELLKKEETVFKSLYGIIVYTYSMEKREPDVIKNNIMKNLPANFKKENIIVIESNSEIYDKANCKLHQFIEFKEKSGIYLQGDINSFQLYGLFMGEILYNQIKSHFYGSKVKSMEKLRSSYLRIYAISYFVFITLNISANLLSDHLFTGYQLGFGTILFIFGILIPSIIILLKPEFFYPIPTNKTETRE